MKTNLAVKIDRKPTLFGEEYVNWFYTQTKKIPEWYPTRIDEEGKKLWAKTSVKVSKLVRQKNSIQSNQQRRKNHEHLTLIRD